MIKHIVSIALLSLITFEASAEVFRCGNFEGGKSGYLLVVDYDTSKTTIFSSGGKDGNHKLLYPKVDTVVLPRRGGLSLNVVPDAPVDWEKVENCYVYTGTSLSMNLTFTQDSIDAYVERNANFKVRPGAYGCFVPRVEPRPGIVMPCQKL